MIFGNCPQLSITSCMSSKNPLPFAEIPNIYNLKQFSLTP